MKAIHIPRFLCFRIFILSACFIFTGISFSCSSSTEEEGGTTNSKSVQVYFGGLQINDADSSDVSTKSAQVSVTKVVDMGNGFDAVCTLSPQQSSCAKSIINMTSGVYYRVIIYNSTGTALVGYKDYVAGASSDSQTPFTLDAGTTYKYVAYSYNTQTAIGDAAPTISTTLTPNLGLDLLYTSGSFTAAYPTTSITLTFKHLVAGIDVELDSNGMFGPMGTTTTSITGQLRKGTLTLSSGSFVTASSTTDDSNVSSASSSTSSRWSSVATTDTTRTVSFYSAPGNTITLNVTFNLIQIKQDYSTTTSGYWEFSNKSVSFGSIALTAAKKYICHVYLRASYLQIGSASDTKWARGNLYLASDGKYKFRHHQSGFYSDTSSSSLEYWNFNSTVGAASTADYGSGDPCAQVLPSGTWRLPTQSELNTLSTESFYDATTQTTPHDAIATAWNAYNYTSSASSDTWGTLRIALLHFGYRGSGSTTILQGPTSLSSTNGYSGNGYYWSSTSNPANNAQAYALQLTSTGRNTRTVAVVSMSKLLGLDVRCVRN